MGDKRFVQLQRDVWQGTGWKQYENGTGVSQKVLERKGKHEVRGVGGGVSVRLFSYL